MPTYHRLDARNATENGDALAVLGGTTAIQVSQQEGEAILFIEIAATALAKFNHVDALTILGCLAELVFQSVPTEVRPNALKAWTTQLHIHVKRATKGRWVYRRE